MDIGEKGERERREEGKRRERGGREEGKSRERGEKEERERERREINSFLSSTLLLLLLFSSLSSDGIAELAKDHFSFFGEIVNNKSC